MKNLYISCCYYALFFLLTTSTYAIAQNFSFAQLQYGRVSQAKVNKDYRLQKEFESRGLSFPPTEIYIRVFKKEGIVEVWAKDWGNQFKKFKEYTVCASSGQLGPKRQQGDKQVPEGFYYISKFNPTSSYHLSLKINYPNPADKVHGYAPLGGDIYIHGACQTVGCVPVSNDKMEEIYWLAVLAQNNGQSRIPVHLFPYKFNNYHFDQTEKGRRPHLIPFWNNLRQGYEHFENTRTLPNVTITSAGIYVFQSAW